MSIAENISVIKGKIIESALRAGRDPASVRLIAVTKTVSADKARECIDAGVGDLGENRVQEFRNKLPEVPGARWHLIGHLQTNKVKYITGEVTLLHSLDRWSLAEEIHKRSLEAGIVTPALVQVNVAGEETKFGMAVQEVRDFITEVAGLSGISIQGLMTIAPLVENPEEVRPVFRQLRELATDLQEVPGVKMEQLSMGMTNDYQVAIEEGATLVRIGTAIFGSRRL
ncbi:alanine racemase domain protein [Desulforamulus reducens MI-1]|uniref:Pyridoxal phosphate homeostasis protein n=1 Tax=Desulforamulus reducens (strain ATCC BAA-1160 / DSM 100696 / MI-1) TaxID=349161 RepID=A4J2E8_DESRM|nr:YggS family pyridoxal phosphate-dependent enzyme [Desulforamulus reducens]ABO49251.1 alanine racemase domain protein [Desulforamulus reducens MI-1]